MYEVINWTKLKVEANVDDTSITNWDYKSYLEINEQLAKDDYLTADSGDSFR